MGPQVVLHELTGQPDSCLCGLVKYAQDCADDERARRFRSPAEIEGYLWGAPVKFDLGEGPKQPGCYPAQRSRRWPTDGFNCWEATAHYLGVLVALVEPVEVHVFDAQVGPQRHVFPAVRGLDAAGLPQPVLLQPPVIAGPVAWDAAQYVALYNLPAGIRLLARKQLDWTDAFTAERVDFVDRMFARFGAQRAGFGPLPAQVTSWLPPEWSHVNGWIGRVDQTRFLFGLLQDNTEYILEISVTDPRTASGGGFSGGPERPPPGAPPVSQVFTAQAWYNDLFGGIHLVGDKALRVFGVGALSDTIASGAGDALPDWARTDDQQKARDVERAKETAEAAKKAAAEAEAAKNVAAETAKTVSDASASAGTSADPVGRSALPDAAAPPSHRRRSKWELF